MASILRMISLLLQLLLFGHNTDALFMWTGPPPAWNQTVSGLSNIQTTVMRVLKGTTNYQIKWTYTLLTGQSIRLKQFSIQDSSGAFDDIGDAVTGSLPVIYNQNEYPTRFRLNSTSTFSTLTINKVSEKENATFRCKMQEGRNTWAYNVRIEVTVPAKITYITTNRKVSKGDTVSLDCKASGYPEPNITWKRVSDDRTVRMPMVIRGKQDQGAYKCIAVNGVGKPASGEVSLTVQTPPLITSPKKRTWKIMAGGSVDIECLAESDPSSRYVWTNEADVVVSDSKTLRLHKVNDTSGGNYICTATNKLGSDKRSIYVLVTRSKIYGTITVDAEYKSGMEDTNSKIAKEFTHRFKKEFDKVIGNTVGFDRSEFLRYRNGSIIVYFVLHFNPPVMLEDGTSYLKSAVKSGAIGLYRVKSFEIIQEFEVDPTTLPSATSRVSKASFSALSPGERGERGNSDTLDGPPWIIIGAAAGGALVLVVIIVLVIWCARRDKKKGGSAALARENEIEHSAVEEHAPIEKPVKKPGEVLYADLHDLDQRPRLKERPYPEAVASVKRPTPYARTDYSEITHFLERASDKGQQQPWPQNGDRQPWIGMQMFC